MQSQAVIKNDTENSYYKVITKCDRSLLQSASDITKCVWYYKVWQTVITKCVSYYKVWQAVITKCDRLLLQSATVITKWEITHASTLSSKAAMELNVLYRLQRFVGYTEKSAAIDNSIYSDFNYFPLVILHIPTLITTPWSGVFVLPNLLRKLRVFKNAALGLYYMIMKVTVNFIKEE